MAFYKNDNGLLEAPNFVLNANYELRADQHTSYEYPTDGWYWFDDINDAYVFFDITPPEVIEEPNET